MLSGPEGPRPVDFPVHALKQRADSRIRGDQALKGPEKRGIKSSVASPALAHPIQCVRERLGHPSENSAAARRCSVGGRDSLRNGPPQVSHHRRQKCCGDDKFLNHLGWKGGSPFPAVLC